MTQNRTIKQAKKFGGRTKLKNQRKRYQRPRTLNC